MPFAIIANSLTPNRNTLNANSVQLLTSVMNSSWHWHSIVTTLLRTCPTMNGRSWRFRMYSNENRRTRFFLAREKSAITWKRTYDYGGTYLKKAPWNVPVRKLFSVFRKSVHRPQNFEDYIDYDQSKAYGDSQCFLCGHVHSLQHYGWQEHD